MKPLIKPRLIPLFGWGVLIAVALFCTYVLYSRPPVFMFGNAAPAMAPIEKDSIEQALSNLAAIKASSWLQRDSSYFRADQAFETLAPSPAQAEVTEAKANLEPPADPSLKGAVVVRSGQRLYLVLGAKRFRAGERIATGETIRSLTLQSVHLRSPEGRARTVEIGGSIGPAAQQTTW
jgi:hypothetical protein